MGYASEGLNKLCNSGFFELAGKIMAVASIILFLSLVLVFFHNLYVKWFLYCTQEEDGSATPDREELEAITSLLHKGLEPSVLESIPVIVFSQKDFKDGLDCVVCLCDVSEGQKARFLPKCNHGFHVDCIDMWFQSHSTCPLCRNPISSQSSSLESTTETILRVPAEAASPNFPTNVLFWGNETEISTFDPLEIANRCPQSQQPCSFSSSSSSSSSSSLFSSAISSSNRPEGMFEEPRPLIPMQLRLLKRLFSSDRKSSLCNPRDFDIELGIRAQS